MKKKTKNLIATLLIVVLFGMSSISFIFLTSNTTQQVDNSQDTQQQLRPPVGGIIEGYLDSGEKIQYVNAGYTVMEFHFNNTCCREIGPSIEALSDVVGSQLIIQKIEDDEYFIKLESLSGTTEKAAPQNQIEILSEMCKIVLRAPIECGLIDLEKNSTDQA